MSLRDEFRKVQTALGVKATGIPNDETKLAFNAKWDGALQEYRDTQRDEAEVPGESAIAIGADDWIINAKHDEIAGGKAFKPECLVLHFTAGAGAKSSIDFMRKKGLSAHVVIDRDGTIYQCRSFLTTCAHAGASRWVNPATGVRRVNLNAYSIGIEIANGGDDFPSKFSKLPPVKLRHRNGGKVKEWEQFPPEQIKAVIALSKALVSRYKLEDVTSHDCIAPERKSDVGPAFPLAEVREACGLTGLPTVHKV